MNAPDVVERQVATASERPVRAYQGRETMVRSRFGLGALVLAAALVLLARQSAADIAVIANDNHTVNTNGVAGPAKNGPPETASGGHRAKIPPRLSPTLGAP